MIGFDTLYTGPEDFAALLDARRFDRDTECLVKIFTAGMGKNEAVRTAREIKRLLPRAHLIGSTAAGIVFCGKQYEGATMVLIERYDHLAIHTEVFSFAGKTSAALAAEVHRAFSGVGSQTVHLLFSDRYADVHAFIEEINSLSPLIRLAGGMAGDLMRDGTPGFVFTEQGALENSAVAFAVTGERAVSFVGINTSQEPISPVFTITETDGCLIRTIENEPADRWLFRYLGIEEMRSFSDWRSIADNDHLVRFPIVLEGHGDASRVTRYDEDEKCLSTYFSKLPAGTRFRIGYTGPSKCVHDCYELCQNIMKQPVERIFVYSCLFRKMYMQNASKWELLPLAEYHVSGAFVMGEIGFDGTRNELFNGSCVIAGTAENERFVLPDISVFDDLANIEDDSAMVRFALTRQKETMSAENRSLMEELIRQRQEAGRRLYVDDRFSLPNVLQYKEDDKKQGFDKVCMIRVENYDVLVAYAGVEAYIQNSREIVDAVLQFMKARGYADDASLYSVNQNTFFLAGSEAVSEARFRHIVQKIYKHFRFYKSEKTGLSQLARFILVLGQQNPLESGLNALQATKDIQSHFLVCDSKMAQDVSYAEELRVIELLNRAISNGGVVPYYQGIRDNREGALTKYEALMRIVDEDGQVYVPAAFMEIAKKYHLYSSLSQMMIAKVLEDFQNRPEEVAINVSMHDIVSKEFREWFFARLQRFPHPDHLTVEFVETEDCVASEELREFVTKLHAAGSKLAIDDFGTGYSTLAEVVNIEPDYIKIDGGIIRELTYSPKSMVLLRTVIFLARQLHIKTVAEFVETEEIQRIVKKSGVDYSQGYLFAQPVSFAERFPVQTRK
ncbi:EAL domain-containing protein [Agathobaculum sp. NTUH-O15-33]|uniref:bifunctional diguanylate cyclase/phosphodiesterase n=1 Tax=Agathobaculum sp. NTUH-O15-33 TaxID=3079302 RepID=UPI002958562C|nr:EAL domain-containing protein [Agathobaculum sp. NTUH-O15-33]WNX85433.1 EAL domain-containing protein [Agathobaculum sp. NTUH-O15-33]